MAQKTFTLSEIKLAIGNQIKNEISNGADFQQASLLTLVMTELLERLTNEPIELSALSDTYDNNLIEWVSTNPDTDKKLSVQDFFGQYENGVNKK